MGSLSTAAAWEFTLFRWDHVEVQSVLTSLYKLQGHNEPDKGAIRHHLSCWIYDTEVGSFPAAVFTGFFCFFPPFLILILNRFFFLNSRINKHLSKVADLLTDEPVLTPNPADPQSTRSCRFLLPGPKTFQPDSFHPNGDTRPFLRLSSHLHLGFYGNQLG